MEDKTVNANRQAEAARPRPVMPRQRVQFGPPPASAPGTPIETVRVSMGKPKREKKPKAKNDPKQVSAARELRDRWMEQVNASGGPAAIGAEGKYDVARVLPAPAPVEQGRVPQMQVRAIAALPEAA